ncbi:MAG: pitrilysin family protein [Planctomycetota bacterium]
MQRTAALALAVAPALAMPLAAQEGGLSYDVETYRLANGLLVTLHEDHSLPQVVIDTWYWVGSKDELPRRTGFAHLFEHLMFMGTERVPDNQFDVLMETGGGWNNASTSSDRTNYFSVGPSALLPTLLWLDADRLEALGQNMTLAKLDSQRAVVRNERRQTSENTPYGIGSLLLPGLMYPEGHPYHHPVIGSHEDLEAATVEDVVSFFDTFYTTTNASLVVAGDFDPAKVVHEIERTFGQIPRREPPPHRSAPPASLAGVVREVAFDKVRFPKLILAWHSPPYLEAGDGEMDLVGSMLADGPSSRLVRKLVHELRIAQDVVAYQASGELGSTFHIEVIPAGEHGLDEVKAAVEAELATLLHEGPGAAELARVQASMEAGFLQGMESLFARADRMNAYLRHFGEADGFQRDLERWTGATPADVTKWARRVFVPEHVDLRILPEGSDVPAGWTSAAAVAEAAANRLDEGPGEVAGGDDFTAPAPVELALEGGMRLIALPRPGSGLFSGAVFGRGGPGALAADQAGLASLAMTMLGSGAADEDAAAFAESVELLGASIDAGVGRYGVTIQVEGLASRLDATLDRFADVVLRPNLTADDFAREKALAEAAVAARADNPRAVATNVARALAFGRAHPSGGATGGYADTVASLAHDDVAPALAALLHPGNATFVFAGDFDPEALRDKLNARFAGWQPTVDAPPVPAAAVEAAPAGRMVVVDRPGAAQTVVYLMRPIGAPASDVARATRDCANTLLGGSFTSRLNQNLRERNNFTYGAGSRIRHEGDQHVLYATTAVHTPVTGAALIELRRELDGLATGNVTADELAKAIETIRANLISNLETTSGTRSSLLEQIDQSRSQDALARDLAALDGVTLEGVNALATSGMFAWSDFQIVLVGDRAAVLPQLEEAGFAAPLAADADGELLD